jgi:hypothetical protein
MQSELKGIVQWLDGTDETQWASKIALAKNCLATMRQRAEPIEDPNKPGSRSTQPLLSTGMLREFPVSVRD